MKRFSSLIEISSFIQSFEDSNKLELKTRSIDRWILWSFLRKQLYFLYRRKYVNIEKNGSKNRAVSKGEILSFIWNFIQLIRLSVFRRNSIIIVSDQSRFLDENANGEKIDFIFDAFINNKELSPLYFLSGVGWNDKNIAYQPDFVHGVGLSIYSKFSKSRLDTNEILDHSIWLSSKLNKFAISNCLDVKITHEDINYLITEFHKREDYYRFLFKCVRPKILLTVNQSSSPIMAAAKKNHIPVYEFQHGNFHANKPDYHVPSFLKSQKDRMPLPDMIVTFGSFFSKRILNSGFWEKKNVFEIGSYKVEKALKKAKPKPKTSSTSILLISQPSCFTKWQIILKDIVIINPSGLGFILKPHPYDTDESCFWLKQFSNENKELFSFYDKKQNLMHIMHSVDCVVGFHSTALYEAAAIGKTVFTFSSNEVEDFIKVENAESLVLSLRSYSYKSFDGENAFAKPCYYKNVNEFISQYLNVQSK